ncbi:cytochrome c oxidase subunit II [Pelomonas sp. SE-A7]|uniref:cytochrome c oxidase subunit II n=1 Tax=Pelomonas sp. SE-A7 TaxID=3054953 RepID=UPI00259C8514|nr:cytochrome c oxidase subunit II [Pelomonas sp. SE-A7]MDM4766480.1 cytochrome c oxidase subunit II [Pelomonas sp. SE-A7]
MLMVIVLIVMVIGSLIFHFIAPWHALPLASNWKNMDDTLTITFVVTGVFFVVLNGFLAYTLLKYRRGAGHQKGAAYQPVDHKMERWLTIVTAVGIAALLAPGLSVYADFVRPPTGAMEVEVLGNQWQWRYRLPGADHKMGRSDARFISPTNPFGLDPDDPAGNDDGIIEGNELRLPQGRPIKMLLRSIDVLHDYYVPQFRARMNMVPGQVSSFWFTPTAPGRYEAMCAQLCGVGHAAMRGAVVVMPAEAFDSWARTLPTRTTPAQADMSGPVAIGQALAKNKGCVACHSIDGAAGVGPSWKGLFGKTESFVDGSQAKVDQAFLVKEISEPTARVVKGFAPVMPKSELSEAEVAALAAYIESLGKQP